MRNAALFSLLAIAVVSLTAGSYAEDWGPGPEGPLGYASRDGIRQGGPNRGGDPNAVPGVSVTPGVTPGGGNVPGGYTPGSEIPGVTPGGGFVPGSPPPKYGKRKPPGYPPPQRQYPPYYPPPQQQYPPYCPPQQQYPPYYPPPQQQYWPPSQQYPPGYPSKGMGQMGLVEGDSRRPRHGNSGGRSGGFTGSPLGAAPSGGPQVRISPGMTFDFPDRHNRRPPRGNRHGDGGHHVPEIRIPQTPSRPPHRPPGSGTGRPPRHPIPELPWLPIPTPQPHPNPVPEIPWHPTPQPPPIHHPEPPWYPTPEIPPNYVPVPPHHPEPEPPRHPTPEVPPNYIPDPPRHPTPEPPEYPPEHPPEYPPEKPPQVPPPEKPPEVPPEYPPAHPPQQQYPPAYPPQQQYPPTYRPPQQQGNPWGKRKPTYVYPRGTLDSTERSGPDRPPAPIASDQRHAPNWGFDYRMEPGAHGYTALVMAVSPDAPAAQARIEPGDRITTINSRPLRGPFDVESVRGYVTFEAVNTRTGQPEWLSAVLP